MAIIICSGINYKICTFWITSIVKKYSLNALTVFIKQYNIYTFSK